MSSTEDDRLQTELSLLEVMYPGQVTYAEKAREVKYASPEGSFQLRLPDGYLSNELPEVLSTNAGRRDLREALKRRIHSCHVGEESLDSIVLVFEELCGSSHIEDSADFEADKPQLAINAEESRRVTVIVWLHHLLNTNKRKLALSPSSPNVSGITKPGRPGVLVYSGPETAVQDHVRELKQLNWQAFQVRMESEEEWSFTHGSGMKEVETMKDAVDEVGEDRRETFMEAVMRMK